MPIQMQAGQPDAVAGGAAAPQPPPAAGGDAQQTVELPMAAFGKMAPKPGSTISLKVVSVDENSGVINATPMPMPMGQPEAGGSDSMAAEFDQPAK